MRGVGRWVGGEAAVRSGGEMRAGATGSLSAGLALRLAKGTRLTIAGGACATGAISSCTGARAFVTIGIRLPARVARAGVTVFFGVAGFLVAWWALPDAAHSYEAFLLIIAYWVGPWLGVVFADQYLRRGRPVAHLLYDRAYVNWGGLAAFVIGLVVSVGLFANQELLVGAVAAAVPELGDVTFFVGFLLAVAAYLLLCRSKIAAEKG